MAPTIPNTPPSDGRCVWNKLPPELKDIIFEMAYIPSKPIRPLAKRLWDKQEAKRAEKEGDNFWPGQFTSIARARFTVNREWCSEALKIFYKHAEFYFKDDEVMNAFVFADEDEIILQPYAERIVSVAATIGIDPEGQYGMYIRVPPDVTIDALVDAVNQCRFLTRLKIYYTESCLYSDLECMTFDHRERDESDWTELYPVVGLSTLYGITNFSIVPVEENRGQFCPSSCTPPGLCRDCIKRPYEEVTTEGTVEDFKKMENILRPVVARSSPEIVTKKHAGVPDEDSPELI